MCLKPPRKVVTGGGYQIYIYTHMHADVDIDRVRYKYRHRHIAGMKSPVALLVIYILPSILKRQTS